MTAAARDTDQAPGEARWTFLTNHSHVLICLARDPEVRMRDLAAEVGITERAIHSLVSDLEAAGYLERRRVGRRNHYVVHPEGPMRHPVEQGHVVGVLLDALAPRPPRPGQPASGSGSR